MSVNLERPPVEEALALSGGLDNLADETAAILTLSSLPLGARLIMRCRKDWRVAAVAVVLLDKIILSVASPSGHTYRVSRPLDAPLTFDNSIPVLGEGCWRAGMVRYDVRW